MTQVLAGVVVPPRLFVLPQQKCETGVTTAPARNAKNDSVNGALMDLNVVAKPREQQMKPSLYVCCSRYQQAVAQLKKASQQRDAMMDNRMVHEKHLPPTVRHSLSSNGRSTDDALGRVFIQVPYEEEEVSVRF